MTRRRFAGSVLLLVGVGCTRQSGSQPKPVDASLMCAGLPDAAESGGKRRKPDIQRTVRAQHPRFEDCYRGALSRNPAAAGRVQTRIVIAANGSVSDACIQKTTLEDGEAVECMLDEFRALNFGSANGAVTVVYPLSYSPG